MSNDSKWAIFASLCMVLLCIVVIRILAHVSSTDTRSYIDFSPTTINGTPYWFENGSTLWDFDMETKINTHFAESQ